MKRACLPWTCAVISSAISSHEASKLFIKCYLLSRPKYENKNSFFCKKRNFQLTKKNRRIQWLNGTIGVLSEYQKSLQNTKYPHQQLKKQHKQQPLPTSVSLITFPLDKIQLKSTTTDHTDQFVAHVRPPANLFVHFPSTPNAIFPMFWFLTTTTTITHTGISACLHHLVALPTNTLTLEIISPWNEFPFRQNQTLPDNLFLTFSLSLSLCFSHLLMFWIFWPFLSHTYTHTKSRKTKGLVIYTQTKAE